MPATSLLELRKFLAPESVFGAGAAALAGRYVQNLGARRVFLVTDAVVRTLPWFSEILHSITEQTLRSKSSPTSTRTHATLKSCAGPRSSGPKTATPS